MGFALRTTDLARLEEASRVLLSPLATHDTTEHDWMLQAGRAVRDFVGGERVVVMVPSESGRYFSEDAPEVADGVRGYIEGVGIEGILFRDPVVLAWDRLRKQKGLEVLTWQLSQQLVERNGYQMRDSPIVSEVLEGQRYRDFAVLVRSIAAGESMIWALHRTPGGLAFGEQTASVLASLLPSFRAGLDAVTRLAAQCAALDTISEPVAVFDADGRERHRNGALAALLHAEPERVRLEAVLARLAHGVRRLGYPLRGERAPEGPPVAGEQIVTTSLGRYTLRAALLPPGAFGPGETLMVSVQADVAPKPLDPQALRERFALTPREAEVVLHLGEGKTNAEIAERLFVSVHTVRHHVENVLAKLEVRTRAAVAARIREAK